MLLLCVCVHFLKYCLGIDDGERYYEFARVIGAAWVSIVEQLEKKPKLLARSLTNYEDVLNMAIKVGNLLNEFGDPCTGYPTALEKILKNKKEKKGEKSNEEGEGTSGIQLKTIVNDTEKKEENEKANSASKTAIKTAASIKVNYLCNF